MSALLAGGARRVAILQSNYLPWKGYFDLISQVDLFVFYDDNQYTKSDWRNRNRVKAAGGPGWLSVPVGADRDRLICDVQMSDATWQEKHWRTLQQNYGKSPHFERYRPWLQELYLGTTWTHLSALNQAVIKHIAHEWLQLPTVFADSRDYTAQGHKLDRLLDVVAKTGAASYLSGPAAKDYIEPQRFAELGVELRWMDYSGYPSYPQRFPPFEHAVTVLDLLFNVGPDAPWYIWGWRDGSAPPTPTRPGAA